MGTRSVPKWRNWQTRRTQNPVPFTRGAGSIPAFGTSFFAAACDARAAAVAECLW